MNQPVALNPNFPLAEANDWISRWRENGGGFYVREGGEGVVVQLARTVDPALEPVREPRAKKLETELLAHPRVKLAVMGLARDAWEKSRVRNEPPAGSA